MYIEKVPNRNSLLGKS